MNKFYKNVGYLIKPNNHFINEKNVFILSFNIYEYIIYRILGIQYFNIKNERILYIIRSKRYLENSTEFYMKNIILVNRYDIFARIKRKGMRLSIIFLETIKTNEILDISCL